MMHWRRTQSARELARVGRKAASLAWLARSGRPVPPFAVVPVDAERLPDEVLRLLEATDRVAIRSSSPDEDGPEHSFAGQFATELDVPAQPEAVADAVTRVVGSTLLDRVASYSRGRAVSEMAVVVQHMVPAVSSGIACSRNPVTGLDEVVVEAIDGQGDALVAGLVTPDRWVYRWGAFTEMPADGPHSLAERVARETRAIADAYGAAVDVEWAWDGATIWWLQVRPITGLDGVRVYSRRIAKEVLPGIITPLTWSVNVPVVNGAWISLLERAVGRTDLAAGDLARRFGGRAYFDMTSLGSVFERLGMPRDSLELLLGLDGGPETPSMRPPMGTALLHAPRLSAFGAWLLRYPMRVPEMLRAIEREAASDVLNHDWSDAELAAGIGRAMNRAQRAALPNIVIPLMAQIVSRRARSALESAGVDPDTVDPTAGAEGAGVDDPDLALSPVRLALVEASDRLRSAATAGDWEEIVSDASGAELVEVVEAYLDRFGALSDRTTDLAAIPWREDPGRVLRLATSPRPERSVRPLTDVAPDIGRSLGRKVARAGRFQILREAVSQAYTRVYMDLRPLLLEAGQRLAERGELAATGDVFFLEVDEVLMALGGAAVPTEELVERQREMAEAETFRVPELIVGDDFVPVPAETSRTELRGVGSAGGRLRGPVRVVMDPSDAPDLPPGTVVVVPHSDVSWTSLFARAAAIVAEAGGMLSHSSIVAREFGIPCVVSAEGACDLPNGTEVLVDGFEGTVTVVL